MRTIAFYNASIERILFAGILPALMTYLLQVLEKEASDLFFVPQGTGVHYKGEQASSSTAKGKGAKGRGKRIN